MPLKKSKGQMYDWVTHQHAHLGGECAHGCSYCYVDSPRFGRPDRFKGELRLLEDEFRVNYGSGRTIFIDHMNDLFADAVPMVWIERVLLHCARYPDNTYVFQTKNPVRYLECEPLPENIILGTTIESNRFFPEVMQKSPSPIYRVEPMVQVKHKKFVTIEPILDFDLDTLLAWIVKINPDFVNIGADSKGRGLPEPKWGKVEGLIHGLFAAGVTIRKKMNLDRLNSV